MVNLTAKEIELLGDFLASDYANNGIDSSPWSWSVTNGSRSKAGVLSSLIAKGLMIVWNYEGKGRAADQVCALTAEGKQVVAELIAKGEVTE